ncbi:amidophosphoribosyltransferase [Candidatus Endomicrobiellum agilis]|jgi:amidophosphoribosyltransferase|uniref:amidophosphoribosyltransferase n=1 Tax=Candidatus Endomicrobiellum agilis TaxID=3238957 RepID=UPI002842DC0D|nr:amidophosphoribosyltransferase [Endomicrobium sp.]MDR3092973.1 amidophosphoribosyltransferase [Endomicrobium sp.]
MCGIIGVENNKNAAVLASAGLLTLQHRGEESAGITISGKEKMRTFKAMGLVSRIFNEEILLNKLPGTAAIGHVRYTTSSKSSLINAQPFQISCIHGNISVAHNGNITNFFEIKEMLLKKGAIFNHTSDTEILLHLIAMSKGSLTDIVANSVRKLEGAFSLVILKDRVLIGVRDNNGFRPLVLGKIGNSYVMSSESAAIEVIGGKYIRDISPGEIIVIENGQIKESFIYKKPKKQNTCIFEQVYFSRPDSIVFEQTVKEARVKMGEYLAQQMKGVKADIVMPVPDTGYFAALGFSRASGILFENGFMRNHYVGRSFIKPSQNLRNLTAMLKLRPIGEVVSGKEIVLIDDSIVRGTTSKRLINILKDAGAKKIHFALSCPTITDSCYYGIDTPSKEHLIAANNSVEKIRKYLDIDSLTFLNLENLVKACSFGNKKNDVFCTACFTGKYPTKISMNV